jgi:hypothetical protein
MHFFKRAKKRAKMPPKKQLKIGVKNRSRTAKNTVNQGSWEQRCKILAAGNPENYQPKPAFKTS